MIRQFLMVGTFPLLAFGLCGCESMKAMTDKVASLEMPSLWPDDDIEQDADGIVMASNEGCPQVAVVDDLKMLSQFETPAAPSPETNVSSVAITGMKSSCVVGENTVAVEIGLRFDGSTGPKTAAWKTENPSFAYPYFVAVTTPSGEILSKEVFAATLRYDQGQTTISQEEGMRQVIPLRNAADAPGYEILIGFQLTDDELAYNRTHITPQPVENLAATATEPQADVAPLAQAAPSSDPVPLAPVTASVDAPEPPEETVATQDSPAVMDGAAAAAIAPAAGTGLSPAPLSPPQQVIKIKADGTVETQKN